MFKKLEEWLDTLVKIKKIEPNKILEIKSVIFEVENTVNVIISMLSIAKEQMSETEDMLRNLFKIFKNWKNRRSVIILSHWSKSKRELKQVWKIEKKGR